MPGKAQEFGKHYESPFGGPKEDRPFVLLKLATSLDGRIAVGNGASAWITSELSRSFVHRLRADADAVLVGTQTAFKDDPELTCRLPGLEQRSPLRVVLDRKMQLPGTLKLFTGATQHPTLLITAASASQNAKAQRRDQGVEVEEIDDGGEQLPIGLVLSRLKGRGIGRLLVEGGGQVAASLIKAQVVDRLAWFHAPRVIGGDGTPAVGALGLEAVAEGPVLKLRYAFQFEGDQVQIFDVE